MKKMIVSNIAHIVIAIFLIWTVLLFIIIYKDIDNSFIFKFVISYVIYLIFTLMFMLIAAGYKLLKLKGIYIRKRIFLFFGILLFLSGTNFIRYYFFGESEITIYKIFSTPLGVSLGIAFFDLLFDKDVRNKEM